jgi:ComEC/Rec2-related protein
VKHLPPAPLVPVALACCVGLSMAPGLGVESGPVGLCGLGLLLVAALVPRVARAACIGGWLLLGLARGSDTPPPQPHDGDALWAIELMEDGRDPSGRPVQARILTGWPPVGGADRVALWQGELDVGLRVPAWPTSAGGRRGDVWLARGRVRSGRRGPTLSVSRTTQLWRVDPAGGWTNRVRCAADDVVFRIQAGARRAIDRGAPARLRPLFLALALGDRRGLEPALRARLSRTGTAHLVALSGLHVGSALLAAAGVARWCLRRLALWLGPDVAWGGGADVLALWVGLAVAASYVLVAGAPVSARRALTMAAAFVLASSLGRGPSAWNALALAALVVAWLEPESVGSLGLQLSLASVAGLLLAAPLAVGGGWRAWRWLRGAVVSSVAATLATAPLLGLAFGQIPLASFWCNPVAIPLLGVFTVPPLLLGAAVGVVSPSGGALLVRAAAVPAGIGLTFLEGASAPEFSPMLDWTPSPAQVLGCYACVALAWWAWMRRV